MPFRSEAAESFKLEVFEITEIEVTIATAERSCLLYSLLSAHGP